MKFVSHLEQWFGITHDELGMWVVLFAFLFVVVSLFREWFRPVYTFFLALLILFAFDIISPSDYLKAFGNKQIIIIFILITLSAAIRRIINVQKLFDFLFRNAKTGKAFTFQLMGSMALLSSFLNNTPIVALMTPYVHSWAKRFGIAPSKLLIPLSYSTMLGGMITIIGTSTNLVLNGFLDQNQQPLLGALDFLPLGLLVSAAGILYFLLIGYKLLPEHKDPMESFKTKVPEYVVKAKIKPHSELIGKTVTEADLRNLKGIFLAEIKRKDKLISPVSPNEVLRSGDKLIFVGNTNNIIELVNSDIGLEVMENTNKNDSFEVIESIVTPYSDLKETRVKDSNFREKFNAVIIAVYRDGERLDQKVGDIVLQSGDLLLLLVGQAFRMQSASVNKQLYVVSKLKQLVRLDNKKSLILTGLLILILTGILSGYTSLFAGLTIIIGVLIYFKVLNIEAIKSTLDLELLLTLAGALAFGDAIIKTGAGHFLSTLMINGLEPFGLTGYIIGIFIITTLLTSFVTNVAAVSVVYPICYNLVQDLGVEGTPFYLAIAFAASAAFMTPVGYQTNLMVYGPGGYRSKDFFKVGFPLTLIYSTITILYLITRYNFLQ